MEEKYETLLSAWLALSIIETPLAGENYQLESSCKIVKKLEEALTKAREAWKCIWKTSSYTKIAKSMEESFSIPQISFENALQHVEFFQPIVHISREKISPDQEIIDVKLVFVRDEPTLLCFFWYRMNLLDVTFFVNEFHNFYFMVFHYFVYLQLFFVVMVLL